MIISLAAGRSGVAADQVDRLLTLMSERLTLASEMAQYKWGAGLPVEDVAQERRILATVAEAAPSYGLTVDVAENFFGSQIAASKTVQRAHFDEWKANGQGPFAGTQSVVPKLAELTPELLTALKSALPALEGPGARERLIQVPQAWHQIPEAWEAAIAPLLSFTAGEY